MKASTMDKTGDLRLGVIPGGITLSQEWSHCCGFEGANPVTVVGGPVCIPFTPELLLDLEERSC